LYANYDEPKFLKSTIVTKYDDFFGMTTTEKGPCHLIPTGIRVALKNENYVAVIEERGSVVKGTPMILRAGVVDYGYSGEIFVAVDCFTDVTINPGEKLPFQLMIHYLGDVPTEETDSLHEYMARANEIESDRNSGCIGSSDKK
jgi:dUTPase